MLPLPPLLAVLPLLPLLSLAALPGSKARRPWSSWLNQPKPDEVDPDPAAWSSSSSSFFTGVSVFVAAVSAVAGGRFSKGLFRVWLKICSFWGLGGPGGPPNHPKVAPAFLDCFTAPRGLQDPEHNRFSVKSPCYAALWQPLTFMARQRQQGNSRKPNVSNQCLSQNGYEPLFKGGRTRNGFATPTVTVTVL